MLPFSARCVISSIIALLLVCFNVKKSRNYYPCSMQLFSLFNTLTQQLQHLGLQYQSSLKVLIKHFFITAFPCVYEAKRRKNNTPPVPALAFTDGNSKCLVAARRKVHVIILFGRNSGNTYPCLYIIVIALCPYTLQGAGFNLLKVFFYICSGSGCT